MSTALVVPIAPPAGMILATPSMDQAREYARRAKSSSTRRAYQSDWAHFAAWCALRGLPTLPAGIDTVACYISDMATDHKASTIQRRLSAISQAHQVSGFDSPTKHEVVRSVLKGIRRTIGTAPNEKSPLVAADIREMTAALPDSLLGTRDRALLLLGFAGAFRRSEIVALNVEDIEFGQDGVTVTLRRSKTDQEGEGRRVGIPHLPTSETCPVRALRAWLDASGIAVGAIFRAVLIGGRLQGGRLSSRAVALIVKRSLPSDKDAGRFSGHSLRAGFVTSAANGGAPIKAIMRQTGHKGMSMVLRYMREASLFRGNALSATDNDDEPKALRVLNFLQVLLKAAIPSPAPLTPSFLLAYIPPMLPDR